MQASNYYIRLFIYFIIVTKNKDIEPEILKKLEDRCMKYIDNHTYEELEKLSLGEKTRKNIR